MKDKLKIFTFKQIKNEFIGAEKRNLYKQTLQLDVLGDLIKKVRLERNITQEELEKLIGVQRAQISKLEKKYHKCKNGYYFMSFQHIKNYHKF